MKAPQARLFKGKVVDYVDWRTFSDGRGSTVYNPLIVFTDGSTLSFTTEETDVDSYSVFPNYTKKPQKKCARRGKYTRMGPRLPEVLKAVYVGWTETERGWGQRSDGCSVHLSREEWERYWDEENKDKPKEVPHEYSFPHKPKPVLITDKKIIAKLTEKKSLRYFNSSDEYKTLCESCKI